MSETTETVCHWEKVQRQWKWEWVSYNCHTTGVFWTAGDPRGSTELLEDATPAHEPPDLTLDVRQVLREHAVWVDAGATVGEVARRMREARVTSVLVRGDPIAIATDRDLRNRVLAEGLGPEAPVASIATPSPRTVATGTPIHEAWAELLQAGVHHLPVVERGEIVGVLTATDLLRCSAQGPMAVLRRVERLASRERLAGYGQTVAEMASALLAGGLDATLIAGFVARLNDIIAPFDHAIPRQPDILIDRKLAMRQILLGLAEQKLVPSRIAEIPFSK